MCQIFSLILILNSFVTLDTLKYFKFYISFHLNGMLKMGQWEESMGGGGGSLSMLWYCLPHMSFIPAHVSLKMIDNIRNYFKNTISLASRYNLNILEFVILFIILEDIICEFLQLLNRNLGSSM